MTTVKLRQVGPYVLAALTIVLMFLIEEAFPLLLHGPPLFFYILVIIISAWLGGLGPGLLATALATWLCGSIRVALVPGSTGAGPVETLRLVVFAVNGVLISVVIEALRHARLRDLEAAWLAQRNQEDLERRVAQRTVELAQVNAALQAEVAERRKAEHALHDSEWRFRAIANFTCDWESWVGDDGRPLWINPAVERLTGFAVEECLAMGTSYPLPMIVSADIPKMEAVLAQARQGASGHDVAFRVLDRDGRVLWMAMSWQPLIGPDGARLGYRSSTRDITDRERAKHALRDAHDDLEQRIIQRTAELAQANQTLQTEIAVRRQAENALRQSQAFYHSLVESLPHQIVRQNLDGRITFANSRFCDALGKPLDQIAGLRYCDIIDQKWSRKCHTDDQRVIATGEGIETVEEQRDAEGALTVLHVTRAPIRDDQGRIIGVQGMFIDITEHRRAEVERAQALRQRQEIMESIPDMIYVLDRDANLISWNQRAETITGYSTEELSGRSAFDFIPAEDHERIVHAIEAAYQEGSSAIECCLQHKDGRRTLYHFSNALLRDENGEPVHLVGTARDITEAKRAEEALQRAKEVAEAANRAKNQFLANVSHEIRTPMNGVLGMTELALQTELKPEQREYLELVRASAHSLLAVINDLLDFSKIEAGKFALDPSRFHLRATLGAVMKGLAPRAHAQGLELVYDVHPDVPEVVVGDPTRLGQVLTNLVGNAIKFTERGEVVVRVEPAEAATPETETARRTRLRFSVQDTGIGIDPSHHRRIFEPFVQADGSMTRCYGGTGLGLAIASRLVALMGGQIELESQPGQGSRFQFTARFDGVETAQAACPATDCEALHGLRVLVVDDNATHRRVLCERLQRWRMQPTGVASPHDALDALGRADRDREPFNFVLLDAQMPQMDGFDLVARMGSQPHRVGPTIMMLGSSAWHQDVARCRDLGVAAYLTKPVGASELLDAILQALGERPAPVRPQHASEERGPSATPAASLPPLRILLAEDNAVNQRLAVRWLERRGHQVVVAPDGARALALWQAQPFDLILMDVQMPAMDGFEATAAIRAQEQARGGHIPIVALTAHTMKGDRERCLRQGFDGYVPKPIQPSELFQTIETLARAAAPEPRQDVPHLRASEGDQGSGRPGAGAGGRNGDHPRGGGDFLGDLDPTVKRELIQLFLNDAPRWLDEVHAALRAQDTQRLAQAAHTLKGAAGHFQAQDVVTLARALEHAGRSGNLLGAEETHQDLTTALQRLQSTLRLWVQSSPEPVAAVLDATSPRPAP